MKTLLINLLLFLFLHSSNGQVDRSNMLGNDIRLYQSTPVWELAKAVEAQDTLSIGKLVSQEKIQVDFRDPKFGQSLLIWAVNTNRYESAKALLKYGADPDLHSTYDGVTALIHASVKPDTSAYVKLLLAHGANPNKVANATEYTQLVSPLIAAASNRLESVKLLIDAGADINYMNDDYNSALHAALSGKKVEITHYLILERKADVKKSFGKTIDTKQDIKVVNLLRNWTFPLGSKEHKKKMEIVAYLEEQGENYWEAPVPKHYYNKFSKEYLKKY